MIDRTATDAAGALIDRAIRERVFPAAVAEVGSAGGVLWRQPFGRLTFDESSPPVRDDTVFDLASLTKPIVTTTVLMQLADAGRLDIREPIAAFFGEWRGEDRERATVQDLLEHASGLSARLVDAPPGGRREFEHDICTMPLEYPPRSGSIYSDLGFILLGFIAEYRGRDTLGSQFGAVCDGLLPGDEPGSTLGFELGDVSADRVAPTQPEPADPRRGRILVGEVHDNYAAALGGVAGHAGLFGTTRGLSGFARTILLAARGGEGLPSPFTPALVAQFTRRSSVPGSSRALGWDTMLATSSCGTEMSPAAFGHVGFTGTSLWIDPVLNRYFVLLTNRVCGGGTVDEMRTVRRGFHDALARV